MKKISEEILENAQKAWDESIFFKRIYAQRPIVLNDVQPTSYVSYHSISTLSDCLLNKSLLVGHIPSYFRGYRQLPMNIVESAVENMDRERRFLRAFEALGLNVERDPLRFLIFADDQTGPFACDLSTLFLCNTKCHVSISYNSQSPHWIESDIIAYRPDKIIVLSSSAQSYLISLNYDCIYFEHLDHSLLSQKRFPVVLACDIFHILAARPIGFESYFYDHNSLIVESDSHSGFCLVTKRQANFLPFIRMKVSLKSKLLQPSVEGESLET